MYNFIQVNSARALLFIQGISTDYSLNIDDYFKLQRFTQTLWAQHESNQLQMQATSDTVFNTRMIQMDGPAQGPKKKITARTADAKKASSLSIADWMDKQGHADKLPVRTNNKEILPSDMDYSTHAREVNGNMVIPTNRLASHSSDGEESLSGKNNAVTHFSGSKQINEPIQGNSMNQLIIDLDALEVSNNSDRGSSIRTGGTMSDHYSPATQHSGTEESPRHGGGSNLLKMSGASPRASPRLGNRQFFGSNFQTSTSNHRSLTTMSSSGHNSNNRSNFSLDDQDQSVHIYGYANSGPNNVVDNSDIPVSSFHPKSIHGRDDVPSAVTESQHCTAFDTVSNWLMIGTMDGAIEVVDLRSFSVFGKLKHGNKNGDFYEGVTAINSIPVPCGEVNDYVFFTGCSAGFVKCWTLPNFNQSSLEMAKELSQSSSENSAIGTKWSSNGKKSNAQFGATSPNWNGNKLRFKQSSMTLKSHTAGISCLASTVFHSGGSSLSWILASGDRKGAITVVKCDDLDSKRTKSHSIGARHSKELLSIVNHSMHDSSSITVMSFVNSTGHGGSPVSMVDPWLAAGNSSGSITVVDISYGTPVFQCDGHGGPVSKIVPLNPNEFLSGGYDRCIKLWDIRVKHHVASTSTPWATSSHGTSGQMPSNFLERSVGRPNWRKCAASPLTDVVAGGWDNSLIIATSADGFIKMWDMRYDLQTPCHSIHGHNRRVSSVIWNGGKEFYTSSYDGTVKSWDSIQGKSTSILNVFSNNAPNFGFSLHGNVGHTVLQEGISSMKMTDFTRLDEDLSSSSGDVAVGSRREIEFHSSKIAKHTQVLVTGGIVGNVKVFATESKM
jgi:hypothetical protein